MSGVNINGTIFMGTSTNIMLINVAYLRFQFILSTRPSDKSVDLDWSR